MAQGSDNWEASADVLTQVEAIEEALAFFGHIPKRLVFTRDAGAFLEKMRLMEIDAVFNLCETVDEDPALCWHPAAVLELQGMPFSGSPSQALMMTADKAVAKQLLLANRIATPGFRLCDGSEAFDPSGLRFPVIVKPRFEDASIGIDQESIFETPETLSEGIESFKARFGSILVEEFVDGREFNVSLFGYPKVRVLPLAEIDFSAFPEDMYRIVGYRAKWDRGSFEYDHTPRGFFLRAVRKYENANPQDRSGLFPSVPASRLRPGGHARRRARTGVRAGSQRQPVPEPGRGPGRLLYARGLVPRENGGRPLPLHRKKDVRK